MSNRGAESNVLIIMSDQHGRDLSGCYGHPMVQTPNIDGLAERGTRFTAAYAPSPICVPSRASFATGRYVHELGLWDNDLPYTGVEAPSWGQRLVEQGRRAVTIGKLHFAESTKTSAFPDQRLPIYVVPQVAIGYLREKMPVRDDTRRHVERAGPGESEYLTYDRAVADEAVSWLKTESRSSDELWALYVSFVAPHFPLLPPPEMFARYPEDRVPLPVDWRPEDWVKHPALNENRRLQAMEHPFTEAQVRRAVAAYFGLVSFMDQQVGRVLRALDEAGLASGTRVIYTADHGETLGAHGLWWKSNMYENSVGIPMIVAGPDVPSGEVCPTPVSLVDVFPSVVDATGATLAEEDASLPGTSLFELARSAPQDRPAFSEYHDAYSVTGTFMLRSGSLKLVHYVGFDPQLFDLERDPFEERDVAGELAYRDALREMEHKMKAIVDPEAVDARARASQEERIRSRGGLDAVVKSWQREGHAYTPVPDQFSPQRLR